MLEKLAAAGTLISWGAFESVVHTADGYSHGVWWTGTSYAAIEKARGELVASAAASASLSGATGHRDYLLRSIAYGSKQASGEGTTTCWPRARCTATRSTSRTCTPTTRCGAWW